MSQQQHQIQTIISDIKVGDDPECEIITTLRMSHGAIAALGSIQEQQGLANFSEAVQEAIRDQIALGEWHSLGYRRVTLHHESGDPALAVHFPLLIHKSEWEGREVELSEGHPDRPVVRDNE